MRLRHVVVVLLVVASMGLLFLGTRLHWLDARATTTTPPPTANEVDAGTMVSLEDLPKQLNLSRESVEVQDERFTCANMSVLRFVDDEPFARGWNKEAWRAIWPANLNKMYTVKRRYLSRAKDKASLARKRAYGLAQLRRELEVHDKLKHWNIATSYGGCLSPASARDDDVAIVAEYVDAYQLRELMQQRLPWCVWTKLALDVGALIKYLDESDAGPAVHCDWKPEQFVVRKKDYRVVLVDVDSIQFYARGAAYLDQHACNGSAPNECSQFEGECFQELGRSMPVPDAQCDVARSRCRGFDTSSMVWVFARGLLVDFLGARVDMFDNERTGQASPDMVRGNAMYVRVLSDVVRNTTHAERRARWSVEAVLKELRLLYAQGNGKQCMTKWQWHRRMA
jgi:hypothetical protein